MTRMRLRLMLARVVLSLAAVVIALLAAEAALRLAGYQPPPRSDTSMVSPTRELDPDVLSVDRSFKEESFYQRPAPGVKMVVALGDSFSFGYPVGPDSSYPRVME